MEGPGSLPCCAGCQVCAWNGRATAGEGKSLGHLSSPAFHHRHPGLSHQCRNRSVNSPHRSSSSLDKGVFPDFPQVENSPSPADSPEQPLSPWTLGVAASGYKVTISSQNLHFLSPRVSVSVAVLLPPFNLISFNFYGLSCEKNCNPF